MNQLLVAIALTLSTALPEPAALSFADFFRSGATRLEASDSLRALDGQRVRIQGFMAHMEDGPSGAFYLASRPVDCDEGGAGTGDLPPDAVLVSVPWANGREVPFVPGRLDVVGTLQLGGATRPDGMPARIRIVLDPPTTKSEGGMVP